MQRTAISSISRHVGTLVLCLGWLVATVACTNAGSTPSQSSASSAAPATPITPPTAPPVVAPTAVPPTPLIVSPTATPASPAAATAVSLDQSSSRCVLLGPTSAGRNQIIFVDPGHGGQDPGAVGRTSAGAVVSEKDLTLAIGLALAPLLRADGFGVVLSRTGDTTVAQLASGDEAGGALTVQGVYHDLQARIDCANTAHASFLLAIHFDAAASSVRGAETLYDTARPFDPDNQLLANLVQHSVVVALTESGWQVPDRGIVDDSTLIAPALSAAGAAYGHLMELGPPQAGYLDRPSQMPGALLEALFITNPVEADLAASADGQQAIALGLQRAVRAYTAAEALTATPQ